MRTILFLLATSLGLCFLAEAQEPTSKPATPKPNAQPAPPAPEPDREIQELIEQLESPSFAIRNQAARKLKASGKRGIKALQAIATTGDAESSGRALKILQDHFQSKENQILQATAKLALEKIAAANQDPSSSIAKRILTKPNDTKPATMNQRFMIPQIRINGGNAIRIQIKAQNNNGKLHIKQNKNGESLEINETKDGIEVQRKDANGKSTKKTYKNAEEMKKKDAEAHQTYQKFKNRGGRIQIQMNGNAKPFPGRPPQLPKLNLNNQKLPEDMRKRHEEISKLQREMMDRQQREIQKTLQQLPEEDRKRQEEIFKRQREMMDRQLQKIQETLQQLPETPNSEADSEQPQEVVPTKEK